MRKCIITMFFIPLLVLCEGCDKGKKINAAPIEVNVDMEVNGSPTDFFENDYRCVELETNDSCLITVSDLKRFEIEKDLIAVQNKEEIFVFDMNGKLKGSFCNQGEGPEEYLEITAMHLYDGNVYILDMSVRAILSYTPSGDFINKINLDERYVDFNIINDNEIVLASGNFNKTMYEFAWIDSKTVEVKSRAGQYGVKHTVSMYDYISFSGMNGDKLVVNVPYILTSYLLGDTDIEPFSYFKFNTLEQMPDHTLDNMDTLEMAEFTRNKPMVRQLGYYLETETSRYESFRLFDIEDGGFGVNIAKYSNDGKNVEQIRLIASQNNTFPYFSGREIKFSDGQLVDLVMPHSLLFKDNREGRDYWSKKGMTEDSNPVLFFYKFK